MHRTRTTIVVAAIAALAMCAPASANYRVGLSEQNAAVFSQPAWQALKLKRIRYIIPWDYAKDPGQKAEADTFLNAARAANQDVLLMFTARRGCWNGRTYSKSSACKAPSTSAYKKAVSAFRKEHSWVKTYAPWNEANHVSQPTSKSPKRAAQYYATLRSVCGSKCKVMAADVLDQSTVKKWLTDFIKYSKNKGRLWGLHNYKDVNRKQSKGLTTVLKTVPGEVWLTETGGITTFAPDFPTSATRAAASTKYMFTLADRFDSKKKGYKSKLTRLYVYRWFGETGNWDSGLVNVDGTPRPALEQFAKYAAKRQK
ncbi:glycosyl hydrolase [Solirubrobacter phytolaccae]|uniref:Glycosyl hydrolase n=1 Tax=Solirubrobacter phytolaccae TaxID=1404360 RepID=A0A9X3SBH1_9ACTN|nr:glycosyl hydrolase [Solirubrobacter phytolaccae]MDA0184683.1 glycosyl hydrolase [Solirubrobacter phytolaccae]